jgi:hypothetical protein
MYPIFAYGRKFKRFTIFHKSKSEFLITQARIMGFENVTDMLESGVDVEECRCGGEVCPGWKIKDLEV